MATPWDDIKWDSKYEKWSGDYQMKPGDYGWPSGGRPGADYSHLNGNDTRFDALEEFNNDYDVRAFLQANPQIAEQMHGGIPQNAGDMNYVTRAMETFHSKPEELGGRGMGGSFSSAADYAGAARAATDRALEDYFEGLMPDADDIAEDTIDEALPDPWWKEADESPERQKQLDDAKKIVNDRDKLRLGTWTGDKYDARKDNEIDVNADMNDPDKELEAMDFANDFKKQLIASMS